MNDPAVDAKFWIADSSDMKPARSGAAGTLVRVELVATKRQELTSMKKGKSASTGIAGT